MPSPSRAAPRRLLRPEPLLFLLWALELGSLAWNPRPLQAAAGLLTMAYVALAAPRARRATLWLCLPLAVLAAGLAQAFGAWDRVAAGFESTAVFMAFFGSILLLRGLARGRPEIVRARALFARLDERQSTGAFLVGAHAIGSILVVGALAILSSILKDDAGDEARRRAAEACQRGMCLAPLWSPFWVAGAVVAQQLPGVPAWKVMSLGLPLAAAGLATAHLVHGRGAGLAALWRAIRGFAPIAPSVALCAVAVAGLSAAAGLGALAALIAAVPALALAALASGRGLRPGPLAAETWRGAAEVRDEIVTVATAVVLGRVLEGVAAELLPDATLRAMALPSWAVIACVAGVVTLGALAGLHQLVTIVVVLAVLPPLGPGIDDVVLTEAALLGWAFASMVGATAVATATASAMFRVPRPRLVYGPNLVFVAVFGAVAIALLTAANHLFFGG